MDVSDAKRLKDLESENARLKKFLAEAMLDIDSAQGCCPGKSLTPQAKREAVALMQDKVDISLRLACRLVGVSRTVVAYEPKANPDNEALSARIGEIAAERRRFGYRRIHATLRREGVEANHKRVYRLYQESGPAVKRRRKRRGVSVEREALSLPTAPNQVWSMDFMMDALSSGRRLKCLTIVDDFTKESVGLVVVTRGANL
jgi:putative transposase